MVQEYKIKKMEQPKIGLALGCGAARGLAHIGVLKVLEKYQIPVDVVTGTSMGAFIGGAYASGLEVSLMEELALKADWKLTALMFLPTISYSGLVNGKRIKCFFEKVIGNRNIEDLETKFGCVATDILTGEEIVIDEGPIIEAIRASISIPTIFTPFYYKNRYLTDGGVVNPVPVDLARRMGADIVIAVNVVPLNAFSLEKQTSEKEMTAYQETGIISRNYPGKKIEDAICMSKIRKFLKKNGQGKYFSPNFIGVALHTVNTFEREIIKLRLERDKPDFLIEPDTSNAGLRGFYKGEEAIRAGEIAAEDIISGIKISIRSRQE